MPKKPASRQFRQPKRVRAPRPNRVRNKSGSPSGPDSDEHSSTSSSCPSRSSSSGRESGILSPTSDCRPLSPSNSTSGRESISSLSDFLAPCSLDGLGKDTSTNEVNQEFSHDPHDDLASDSMSIASASVCNIDTFDDISGRESVMSAETSETGYCSTSISENVSSETTQTSEASSNCSFQVPLHTLSKEECRDLLLEVNKKVGLFLPDNWISLVDGDSINVMLLSRKEEKAIQRRLNFSASGNLHLSVHGKPVDLKSYIQSRKLPGALCKANINDIVDLIVTLVSKVRAMEICSGADHSEYKEAWNDFANSYVDKGYFQECRYEETLRVNSCKLLVEPRVWRCTECNKACDRLRKRIATIRNEEPHPCTANKHLTKAQSLKKMKLQHNEIEAKKKKIERLQEKVSLMIKKEGMNLDEDLAALMQSAVQAKNLNPLQSMFLQQQLKAQSCKNSRGHRWHPVMIQFAMSLFLTSPAAYNIIIENGMMRLPSTRTLFDYTHVFEAQEGICMPIMKTVSERLKLLPALKFKWHTLLCDEMYISKNVVYHKASGTLMGYVQRTDVETSLTELQDYLDNTENIKDRQLATKVLSFMIKGVCTDVKEVVASFAIHTLTKLKMYSLTWKVITECERSGIQIIAMTSDGNSVNRAFYKMNTPITQTKSGVVFDTINKAAPTRPLYFMSDVPHLIKTIRNNFHNSRTDKKAKRCLMKDGQKIVWNTIIRLFNAKKNKILRKAYKLNLANVYLDSYSCMKVLYAFQVLSKTVAGDIKAQGWPETSATVDFILRVNNLADCLNGPHTSTENRTGNTLLAAYRSVDDPRFKEILEDFLTYLEKWKEEAEREADQSMNTSFLNQTTGNADNPDDSFTSLHDFHEASAPEENQAPETPAHKRQLCHQTLEGIEITIRGFTGAVQHLLGKGEVDYINARVFCQDPLEQFFSKQRYKGGGSNTPNLQKYLENARAIHVQRGLSVRKRTGNTTGGDDVFKFSNEKLPRRAAGPTI